MGGQIELKALDNTENKWTSAAEAFNDVLEQDIEVDTIVFCHQDIIWQKGAIDKVIYLSDKYPKVLFGAAGVRNSGHLGGKRRILSRMALFQEGWNYDTLQQDTIEEVFTLDECMFFGNKELFQTLRFYENVCNGWHFYGVELCLQCQKRKIPVRVFDANIIHLSGGNIDKTFFECEKRVAQKYKDTFKK